MKKLTPPEPIDDDDWGCTHTEFVDGGNGPLIKACIVSIEKLDAIAKELTRSVLDTSWMMSLDKGTQRTYKYTAEETAQALVVIFNEINSDEGIGLEFGEVMVSMGSSRSLSQVFKHISLPIAELWKPQKKQNEGFDFHTTCPQYFINFGEAKYSGVSNPHGNAIKQANEFINVEKHFRDRAHLKDLTEPSCINNLDSDNYGVVAAFSINSENHESIMKNAVNSVKNTDLMKNAKVIYLVGVVCK